jgi:hypothetical protein
MELDASNPREAKVTTRQGGTLRGYSLTHQGGQPADSIVATQRRRHPPPSPPPQLGSMGGGERGMNRANGQRVRVKDKGRARGSFPLPLPHWMGEVACHVTKSPKCVALDERRWQKCRTKPKSPISRSAISKSGK